VGFCMAAGIDGICLMRRRTGNQIGTTLRDLEKLREEATEFGRRKIRRLFGEDNLGSEGGQRIAKIDIRQLRELQFGRRRDRRID